MRSAIFALALLLLPACAHAQGDPVGRGDLPDVRAPANIILLALPETEQREHGYRWDAVSIRISRFLHWHIYAPDRRDRPADAIVERHGWIECESEDIGVSIQGTNDRVTALSVDYDRFRALDLLEGLRREGADVRFQADYETYSEYVIVAPGLLTTRRRCPPDTVRYAPHCQDSAELTFDPFEAN